MIFDQIAIFILLYVFNPVQIVFNLPMTSYTMAKEFSSPFGIADIQCLFIVLLPISFSIPVSYDGCIDMIPSSWNIRQLYIIAPAAPRGIPYNPCFLFDPFVDRSFHIYPQVRSLLYRVTRHELCFSNPCSNFDVLPFT